MIVLYIILGIVLAVILFYTVCALLVNPKKEYDTESPFYRSLLNGATGFVLKLLRIHIHTSGLEKMPSDCRFLLVSNHRSNYDPIVSWYVFRKYKPAYISKASNFKIPIFGRIIRKCCFMAIDRENPRKALVTIKKSAALLQKGVNSVAVYPEGTRSKTCVLLPFHNSVLKIAQIAKVPIVVMTIDGTEQIHKHVPFRKTDVYLNVETVLPLEDIEHKRTSEIGDNIRGLMEKRLSDTNGEDKKDDRLQTTAMEQSE